MLDAAQARLVAYRLEDGDTICADHADEQYRERIEAYRQEHQVRERGGWSFDVYAAFEAFGLSPYSRYDIDTMAGEAAYHLEPDEVLGALSHAGNLYEIGALVLEAYETGTELGSGFAAEWIEAARAELSGIRCLVDGVVI